MKTDPMETVKSSTATDAEMSRAESTAIIEDDHHHDHALLAGQDGIFH